MRNLRQRLKRVGERATKAEREILIFLVTMMVVIVSFGIVVRWTPITGHTLWTVELSRLFLLFAAFWAAGSVERVDGHFKFVALDRLFKGKCRLFVQLFTQLVLLITIGIVIWWTIAYSVATWGIGTRVLHWPLVTRALPLLLGCLLIVAYCLTAFIRNLRRLFEQC